MLNVTRRSFERWFFGLTDAQILLFGMCVYGLSLLFNPPSGGLFPNMTALTGISRESWSVVLLTLAIVSSITDSNAVKGMCSVSLLIILVTMTIGVVKFAFPLQGLTSFAVMIVLFIRNFGNPKRG